MPTLRLAIVAGESSGDLLGSRLLRALHSQLADTRLELFGIGGDAMQAEGLESLFPMERLAVMGLVEPIGRLPELLRIRRELRRTFLERKADLFIGIDAPDFNIGLARRLRERGMKTAQLVSPTVWAWRSGRVHSVARAVDSLWCLFPFEPPLYSQTPVDAHFVGHPLVAELSDVADRISVRSVLDIGADATVIALLPGSRGGEVRQLAETLIEAGRLLQSRDERRLLLMPAANEERYAQLRAALESAGMERRIRLLHGQSREAMLAADVVLLSSGTATLEAMLLRRPMVVAYRMAPLSWSLISRLAVTDCVALPNIIAGERVVPELLQDDLNAPALALEAEALLHDGAGQVARLDPHRATLERDFDASVINALMGCVRG